MSGILGFLTWAIKWLPGVAKLLTPLGVEGVDVLSDVEVSLTALLATAEWKTFEAALVAAVQKQNSAAASTIKPPGRVNPKSPSTSPYIPPRAIFPWDHK